MMKLNLKMLSSRRINIVLIPALLSIFVVLLMLSGVMSSDKNSAVKKNPSIHFPVTHHDFGKVSGGNTVSHRFIFHNRGEDVLLIKRIAAG
jgi:hypothetical protein